MTDKENRGKGRPSKYTEELAKEICLLLQTGKSLTKICEQEDMPCFATVNNWLHSYEDFLELYQRARLIQADYRSQEIYNLPFDCEKLGLEASYTKLKMDGAKWDASKGNPTLYGDNSKLELSGDPKKPIVVEGVLSKLSIEQLNKLKDVSDSIEQKD